MYVFKGHPLSYTSCVSTSLVVSGTLSSLAPDIGTVGEEDMGRSLVGEGEEILGGGEDSKIGGSEALGTNPGIVWEQGLLDRISNLGWVTAV